MTGITKVERYAFSLYRPINEETCKRCEYKDCCLSLHPGLMGKQCQLSIEVAAKLTRELGSFPKNKITEVAIDVLALSKELLLR